MSYVDSMSCCVKGQYLQPGCLCQCGPLTGIGQTRSERIVCTTARSCKEFTTACTMGGSGGGAAPTPSRCGRLDTDDDPSRIEFPSGFRGCHHRDLAQGLRDDGSALVIGQLGPGCT
jgi:hypothetical protein